MYTETHATRSGYTGIKSWQLRWWELRTLLKPKFTSRWLQTGFIKRSILLWMRRANERGKYNRTPTQRIKRFIKLKGTYEIGTLSEVIWLRKSFDKSPANPVERLGRGHHAINPNKKAGRIQTSNSFCRTTSAIKWQHQTPLEKHLVYHNEDKPNVVLGSSEF